MVDSGRSMTSDSWGIMAEGGRNMKDNIGIVVEEKKKWQKNDGSAQATSRIMWPLKIKIHAQAKVMNSMYSHQERSQDWANRVSEEHSGWYAQKLVRQAGTTVSEKELLLQGRN